MRRGRLRDSTCLAPKTRFPRHEEQRVGPPPFRLRCAAGPPAGTSNTIPRIQQTLLSRLKLERAAGRASVWPHGGTSHGAGDSSGQAVPGCMYEEHGFQRAGGFSHQPCMRSTPASRIKSCQQAWWRLSLRGWLALQVQTSPPARASLSFASASAPRALLRRRRRGRRRGHGGHHGDGPGMLCARHTRPLASSCIRIYPARGRQHILMQLA